MGRSITLATCPCRNRSRKAKDSLAKLCRMALNRHAARRFQLSTTSDYWRQLDTQTPRVCPRLGPPGSGARKRHGCR